MRLTKNLICGVAALLSLWEMGSFYYNARHNNPDDDIPDDDATISASVWDIIKGLLVIRFLAGFLFSHFMFQRGDDAQDGAFWQIIRRWPSLATWAGLASGYAFWQRSPHLSTVKKD